MCVQTCGFGNDGIANPVFRHLGQLRALLVHQRNRIGVERPLGRRALSVLLDQRLVRLRPVKAGDRRDAVVLLELLGRLGGKLAPERREVSPAEVACTGESALDGKYIDAEILDPSSALPEAPVPADEADDVFADLPELPDPGAAPSSPFETLTTEELEEFERFDRQRRDRVRRSS